MLMLFSAAFSAVPEIEWLFGRRLWRVRAEAGLIFQLMETEGVRGLPGIWCRLA